MQTYTHEDNSTSDLPAGVIGKVQGRAGTADVINANGRLYPAAVYRRAVQQFQHSRSGDPHHRPEAPLMLGELDHPEDGSGPRLAKTALRVTELRLVEQTGAQHLEFSADLLNTPSGRILKALLHAGVPVNVSTRGVGSLEPVFPPPVPGRSHSSPDRPSYLRVGEDYELHGIDAVARGAHFAAHFYPPRQAEAAPAAQQQYTQQYLEQLQERSQYMRGNRPAEGLELNERPGPGADAVNRIAALEAELSAARSDLEVLQAAASVEHGAVNQALEEAQDRLRTTEAEHRQALAALQEQVDALTAERDEALAEIHRRSLEAQINALLQSLRPDLRERVAEQLRTCESPEQVTERWQALEQVLSAAGLGLTPPAGSGRVHPADSDTVARPEKLSPEQHLQRLLLGI